MLSSIPPGAHVAQNIHCIQKRQHHIPTPNSGFALSYRTLFTHLDIKIMLSHHTAMLLTLNNTALTVAMYRLQHPQNLATQLSNIHPCLILYKPTAAASAEGRTNTLHASENQKRCPGDRRTNKSINTNEASTRVQPAQHCQKGTVQRRAA